MTVEDSKGKRAYPSGCQKNWKSTKHNPSGSLHHVDTGHIFLVATWKIFHTVEDDVTGVELVTGIGRNQDKKDGLCRTVVGRFLKEAGVEKEVYGSVTLDGDEWRKI